MLRTLLSRQTSLTQSTLYNLFPHIGTPKTVHAFATFSNLIGKQARDALGCALGSPKLKVIHEYEYVDRLECQGQ